MHASYIGVFESPSKKSQRHISEGIKLCIVEAIIKFRLIL